MSVTRNSSSLPGRGRVSSRLPWLSLLLAWLLTGGLGASPARADAPRPNIVVLMTDDQTVSDMQALPRTRALIGGQGVAFSNFFASYPLCGPSRTTFLTGQFEHNHGVRGNLPPTGGYGVLRGKDDTLPVWLQNAGYATAHIGKYPNGYGRDVPATVPAGWTEWYGSIDPYGYLMWGYKLNENGTIRTYGSNDVEDPALYQTDVYGAKAVDFIRRRARSNKPFFLDVAFLAPHSEAGREVKTDEPTVRPAPRDAGRFADAALPEGPEFNEADVSDKPAWFGLAYAPMSPAQIAFTTNSYRSRLASLIAVDDAVEDIVGELRRTGELDNTLILFVSDNGFFYGEHRIPFGKYFVYEPAARVPLLMRGPGVRKGARSAALVENTDLAATLVAVAHARPGRLLDGQSLMPFAAHPQRRTSRPVLIESGVAGAQGDIESDDTPYEIATPPAPRYAAIHTRRYVYIRYSDGSTELYDLHRDAGQLRSRAGDPAYRRTAQALSKQLTQLARCKGHRCVSARAPIPGPTR
jgi:arylsulfatase A-like enzyme